MTGLKMWQSQGWQLTMSDFAMYDFQTIIRYVYMIRLSYRNPYHDNTVNHITICSPSWDKAKRQ